MYRSQVDQLRLKLMEILIKNKKIVNEIIIDDNKNKVANTRKNVALMSNNRFWSSYFILSLNFVVLQLVCRQSATPFTADLNMNIISTAAMFCLVLFD